LNQELCKVAVTSRSFSKHLGLREELLKKYPETDFNDLGELLSGQRLVEFLSGHTKAITALEILDESILRQLPELEVISKYGVGLDMLDLSAMSDMGKKLGWTSGVNRRSVSELVISFMISSLRKLTFCQKEIFAGRYRQIRGRELSGRTVGIIGCGNIGKDLVELLKPFNCTILVHDIVDYTEFYMEHKILSMSKEELLRSADLVTLHVPLDDSTRGMIGTEELKLMKQDSVLINAARGNLVDEVALLEGLKKGELGAAAFDVLAQEPPQNFELLNHDNFQISPHIGGSTEEAIWAMGMAAIEGLDKEIDPLEHGLNSI
jgi:phosphoglycerate dehydrogenase-like enzyme